MKDKAEIMDFAVIIEDTVDRMSLLGWLKSETSVKWALGLDLDKLDLYPYRIKQLIYRYRNNGLTYSEDGYEYSDVTYCSCKEFRRKIKELYPKSIKLLDKNAH